MIFKKDLNFFLTAKTSKTSFAAALFLLFFSVIAADGKTKPALLQLQPQILAIPDTSIAYSKFSHALWNQLIKKYAIGGKIDYSLFQSNKEDRKSLRKYLEEITKVKLETLSPKGRKALFINAFNASIVSLILQRYPIRTVDELGGTFRPIWKKETTVIGEKKYSLNRIAEIAVGEGPFYDFRVFFALCKQRKDGPSLWEEAFREEQIDKQLDDNLSSFVTNRQVNYLNTQESIFYFSPIFRTLKKHWQRREKLFSKIMPYLNKEDGGYIKAYKVKIDYMPLESDLRE